MKYFIDTEFIEGFHKPLFGKRRHFIDLISIAIVAEDGREYQAISREYSYKDASEWVRNNVIIPLYMDTVHGYARYHIHARTFHLHYGKSKKQIAEEIVLFINHPSKEGISEPHKFYADYADYDWVLLCSLFGTMMDLPSGFPMYCRDINQMWDELREKANSPRSNSAYRVAVNKALADYRDMSDHTAIGDAREAKRKYEFLKRIIDNPNRVAVSGFGYQNERAAAERNNWGKK